MFAERAQDVVNSKCEHGACASHDDAGICANDHIRRQCRQSQSGAGTTINNGNGQGSFFRRADPPSNTVGNAGDATINNRAGSTVFIDDSTANAATINNSNNGETFFNNSSTADHATINNGQDGSTWFSHESTASRATIGNIGAGARTIFEDTATAGGSTTVFGASITNRDGGSTQFIDASTASHAAITNEQNGTTSFAGQSTADRSIIHNHNGGGTTFSGNSVAGASTIDNRTGGSTEFGENSSANIAKITNDNGQTSFRGTSTAGGASILSVNDGRTTFFDRSSAGNATIESDNGGVINNKNGVFFQGSSGAGTAGINVRNGALAHFGENSTAGAATINSDHSLVEFSGTSTAGSATITVKNNGSVQFYEGSTAGNAILNNGFNSGISFNANSTAGDATINNNQGIVVFDNNSTAGNARLINGDGNRIDFSGTTGAAGDGKVTAGSIAGGGTFSLGGNQLTVGGNGDSTTVHGVIADGGLDGGTGGSVVKTGGGTLTLSGANTYSGGTELHGGVLSVSADANLGAAPGGLIFSGGTLATTASFMTARNVSVQQSGTFDIAGGTALGLFGTVSGAGDLRKAGAGVLVYDGNSAGFAGNTAVTAGALIVGSTAGHGDAVLGGSFNVANGGTLAGHGVIGSGAGSVVTISAGGTLSPGNSVGTLSVNGNLAMAAGSHLAVEIDASGAADRVAVSGTGNITGAVLDVSAQGAKIGRYTIVTTAGGLTGTFGSVTRVGPISAFTGITDSYDANNAYLEVLRVRDLADAGLTRNQKSAAAGIQSLSGGDPLYAGNLLYDAILHLATDADARRAFDQVSGEVHASAKTALIEDSRFLRNSINDRVRAAFEGVGAMGGTVVTYENGQPRLAPANTDRLALWGQGFGSLGHTGSDGNAARLTRSTGGFFMGLDAPVLDSWRLGAVAGYSRTSFNVKDRASSGSSDNYHLGLYGGTVWSDLAFRTGAAYTWHDIAISRSVAFPGFVDNLKGDYRAATAQVFGELAYGLNAGRARFEPFANLAYVNLNTDGFSERGGAAALTSASSNADATFTTLGLRGSGDFTLGGVGVTARGTLGWRHAFGDVTPVSIQRFVAGSNAFAIWGVPIARDAAVVEVGLDYAVAPNATLGVSYNAQLGPSASDLSIRSNFNMKF